MPGDRPRLGAGRRHVAQLAIEEFRHHRAHSLAGARQREVARPDRRGGEGDRRIRIDRCRHGVGREFGEVTPREHRPADPLPNGSEHARQHVRFDDDVRLEARTGESAIDDAAGHVRKARQHERHACEVIEGHRGAVPAGLAAGDVVEPLPEDRLAREARDEFVLEDDGEIEGVGIDAALEGTRCRGTRTSARPSEARSGRFR